MEVTADLPTKAEEVARTNAENQERARRLPATPALVGELLHPKGRLSNDGPPGILTKFGRGLRRVRLYGMITELWEADNGQAFFRFVDLTGGITLSASRFHPRVAERLAHLFEKKERYPQDPPSVMVVARLVPRDGNGSEDPFRVRAYAEELNFISPEERMAWLSEVALATAAELDALEPDTEVVEMFEDLLLNFDKSDLTV